MIACARLHHLPPAAHHLDDVLALLAEEVSPQVEAEGPLDLRADARPRRTPYALQAEQVDEQQAATCYLDLGSLTPEQALPAAVSIHRLVAAQLKLSSTLGLASGKFAARLTAASLSADEMAIVTPGEEAAFLARFPVSALPVDGETLRQLRVLGLNTLGQLAALPAPALLGRFGRPGQLMHRLASGRDTSRVARYQPPVTLGAAQTFDWVVNRSTVLQQALQHLVETLVGQLAGRTASQVTLHLTLEAGTVETRTLALRQPTASAPHLLGAAQEMLASLPLSSGVVSLRLTLGGVRQPVSQQLSLFEREPVSQTHLRAVLADLIARHGECFYHVVTLDEQARLPRRRFRFEKVEVG